jgi:aromatic ring-cleaving dioxygenase
MNTCERDHRKVYFDGTCPACELREDVTQRFNVVMDLALRVGAVRPRVVVDDDAPRH